MTIAFVSDAIYPYNKGGKEKRLYELSTRMAQLGHDVHIYTMHWWDSPEKQRVEDGVQLHAICKYYPLYSGDKRSIKEGILFGIACFRLVDVDADVYDVDHMPFFPILSSWIVLTLRGRKLHSTWHEALSRRDWVNYMGPSGNLAALIERISIHLPYRILAGSFHTKKLIKTELKRSKRVTLATSGIDTDLIAHVKPAKIKCDVLYTGRLVKDKNVDKLIEAISIVYKYNPSIRCTIVGHGVEQESLNQLIIKLNLERVVTLLSPLPNATDVYAYMKTAKVFCLPSVREGFGIVVAEALGCGTPVITTDSAANASKDLITHGRNGAIVAPTPSALANAINEWTSISKPKNVANDVASYDWNALALKQTEAYL